MRVRRDPLYLFACHLEWRDRRNLEAHKELVAALDDHDDDIRHLAELLLHRSSPRPEAKSGKPAREPCGVKEALRTCQTIFTN